ncbi:MAG: alcohol dehydrogenase catalytic domain-containing protein [Clostridia bacterium]|nr:alcohol dehydrogenase catalytic domain-containing protein [Clostridia bacterium]
MLAARFYGIGDVRVEDVPIPPYGPGEALVKVAYAGICGSDLHVFRKGMFVTSVPVTMGHEFCGTVEAVGLEVTNVKPGDRVVGDPRVSCGTCRYCQSGMDNCCPQLGFIGEVSPGCFAEYIAVDSRRLLKIPPEVDLKLASLAEPLAVAVRIARQARISPNDSLGIVGVGPVGLLTLAVTRTIPVSKVTAIDLSPSRRELARKMGADCVLAGFSDDLVGQADVAVEAAGTEATLSAALRWVRPKGRVVMAGIYEKTVSLDPNDIINKEVEVAGSNAYDASDLHDSVRFLAKASDTVAPIISHILPLEKAPEAFALLLAPERSAAKVLLTP